MSHLNLHQMSYQRAYAQKHLELDFRFPTEGYAYLSIHMPQTDCEAFAPYVPTEFGCTGKIRG